MDNSIIVGDIHFGRKNNSRERHDDTMIFIRKFLIPFIKQYLQKYPTANLIFTGDIFDSKQNIDTLIANDCFEIFAELGQMLEVIIYIGNHDLLSRTGGIDGHITGSVYNSAKPLKWIPNVKLFESYTEYDGVAFLPFYKNKLDEIDFIEKCKCDTIFTHTEYSGFYYEGKMIDESPKSINPDVMKKFKRVFNGHIHGRQEKFNICIVGTPYQMKFGEHKNATSITIYDHKKDKIQFIDNPVSPKFKIFHFFSFLDKTISEVNAEIKNNYCRIITPSELFDKVDTTKIIDCLDDSYKELNFDPTNSIKREDIPTADSDDDDLQISAAIDIRVKYGNYVTDTIDIGGVMVDADTKKQLSEDFNALYAEAELKVNVNDLDFS